MTSSPSRPRGKSSRDRSPGNSRSRAILLSKRANAYLLERAKVLQKDGRLLFLTDNGDAIEHFFNIPHKNTAFLLLGQGTSLTSSAARLLAHSGVMVGFVGTGGSPLLSGVDAAFLTPESEYRPTEYLQGWMRMWMDEEKRLAVAREFLRERSRWVQRAWNTNAALKDRGIEIDTATLDRFDAAIEKAPDTDTLLGGEAVWAKSLYAKLAQGFTLDFRREEGMAGQALTAAEINSYLDHGNYIAYGFAAVALYALGISFALPVLHGKTRRGALVFDVADLFKDAIVMPMAFDHGSRATNTETFRDDLIEKCINSEVVDNVIEILKRLSK